MTAPSHHRFQRARAAYKRECRAALADWRAAVVAGGNLNAASAAFDARVAAARRARAKILFKSTVAVLAHMLLLR